MSHLVSLLTRSRILHLLALLTLWMILYVQPVQAADGLSSTVKGSSVLVQARVLPRLTVILDYPSDGNSYIVTDRDQLTFSGLTNLRHARLNVTVIDLTHPAWSQRWQSLIQLGPWQRSVPSPLLAGDYQVFLLATDPTNGDTATADVRLNVQRTTPDTHDQTMLTDSASPDASHPLFSVLGSIVSSDPSIVTVSSSLRDYSTGQVVVEARASWSLTPIVVHLNDP